MPKLRCVLLYATVHSENGGSIERGTAMRISYNKLWKLLIDREMTKMDLKDAAGISAASIAKLGKGANITTDVLLKICETLNVHIEDILETRDD